LVWDHFQNKRIIAISTKGARGSNKITIRFKGQFKAYADMPRKLKNLGRYQKSTNYPQYLLHKRIWENKGQTID